MAEVERKVQPPLPVKGQLVGATKKDRERRPPRERFAIQTFSQLVPGIQACKEMILIGTMPPADVVQAAGALNAAMSAWFNEVSG